MHLRIPAKRNWPRSRSSKTLSAAELSTSMTRIMSKCEARDNKICFSDLVMKNPRPYDVVILYTVQTNCDLCEEVMSEYESVVYSYLKNKDKV